jgi:hypothetical protein
MNIVDSYGATIWTQDSDFKEIDGAQYFAKKRITNGEFHIKNILTTR